MHTLPLNLPMLSAKTAARERKLGHVEIPSLPCPLLRKLKKFNQSTTALHWSSTPCVRGTDGWICGQLKALS